MKWSKLRKLVEDCMSDDVKDIISIHTTTYRKMDDYSRSWIEIDGNELVSFSDIDTRSSTYHVLTIDLFTTLPKEISKFPRDRILTNPDIQSAERTPGLLVEPGEFSSYDFQKACFEHVTATRARSMDSRHPLLRALAIIDRKVGAKRVEEAINDAHPLVAYLAKVRLSRVRSLTNMPSKRA